MPTEDQLFSAVDALLEHVAQGDLPAPVERRRLREAAGLSQAQVATALTTRRETVASWEAGQREPRPPQRAAYARLLEELAKRFPTPVSDSTPVSEAAAGSAPAPADDGAAPSAEPPADLAAVPPAAAADPSAHEGRVRASGRSAAGGQSPSARRKPARRHLPGQDEPSEAVAFIAGRVQAALVEYEGDAEAAIRALKRKAIPDVMDLLEICRNGGRYEFSVHPPSLPDILHKQPRRDSDDIWEARPKWAIPPAALPAGEHEVTALDINGAYLSALKTHLPIGALEHHLGPDEGGPAWDRRRSGVHRITPPAWPHVHLPNPLGNREEPGPLWVTESTLRLFQRAAAKGWCEAPVIHESFTSGASEGLLDKLREGLTTARRTALAEGDEVTVEYVKAMYAKLVSTVGESNFNREIRRPDWVHIIRSQAFANLWHKAERAHRAGLHVVRMMGTDELHVVGDWRQVFTEGRDVSQVKVKDTYTVTGEGA